MKNKRTARPLEIVNEFNAILDKSIHDLLEGKSDRYLEIREISSLMCIDVRHLSNTIRQITKQSPCDLCNEKTLLEIKKLLAHNRHTIAEIARIFTFEPTNFTKYFKRHTGITPSAYRQGVDSETFTMPD